MLNETDILADLLLANLSTFEKWFPLDLLPKSNSTKWVSSDFTPFLSKSPIFDHYCSLIAVRQERKRMYHLVSSIIQFADIKGLRHLGIRFVCWLQYTCLVEIKIISTRLRLFRQNCQFRSCRGFLICLISVFAGLNDLLNNFQYIWFSRVFPVFIGARAFDNERHIKNFTFSTHLPNALLFCYRNLICHPERFFSVASLCS